MRRLWPPTERTPSHWPASWGAGAACSAAAAMMDVRIMGRPSAVTIRLPQRRANRAGLESQPAKHDLAGMTAFSVLDLSPIVEGGDARRALLETTAFAQAADRLGFNRFWVAEHHNMPGIASAATAVVIGQIAGATERIRVGSGG